ncbi:TPA: hypothetical protein QDC22_007842 [Burkholderia stabilis]|nr:hypothetical protein [Burkholderia stabilis]HDR9589645.1 hypothetical protein [Burkholderia stabilis]HDR9647920.1 hypothetical protein [Burkholderia stabilis]HDR9653912.1 hypothetical protein [Burkholderia stabilis]HDR9654173.1 hypothetical protein [Burkholderia stabilis]
MLIACTGAFLIGALREPVALPHDAMIGGAPTCLLLGTVLLAALLAASFDLFRLIRCTLGALGSVAEGAGNSSMSSITITPLPIGHYRTNGK